MSKEGLVDVRQSCVSGEGACLSKPLVFSQWLGPSHGKRGLDAKSTAALGQLHPWSSRSVRFIFLNPTPPQRCQSDLSKMQSHGAIPQLKHLPWLPSVLRLNP